MDSHIKNSQSGNVLWFILLGIALLGTLTMIVTRSGNKVEQSGSFEQYQIEYSKIMRYATSVEQGIQKLMSINGCSENDISFENSIDTNYTNSNNPGTECFIFDPAGAGLSWKEFNDNTFGGSSSNVVFTYDLAIEGIGDDSNGLRGELIFVTNVSKGMCDFANSKLGIDSSGINTDNDEVDFSDSPFIGYYGAGYSIETAGKAPGLIEQPTGCMAVTNGAIGYALYHVLLAR